MPIDRMRANGGQEFSEARNNAMRDRTFYYPENTVASLSLSHSLFLILCAVDGEIIIVIVMNVYSKIRYRSFNLILREKMGK